MQIIRFNVIKHYNFLGRVDRDIEDVMPKDVNMKLSQTVAVYDLTDIAQKAILLTEIMEYFIDQLKNGNERLFEDWILKQIAHEKNKLRHYL